MTATPTGCTDSVNDGCPTEDAPDNATRSKNDGRPAPQLVKSALLLLDSAKRFSVDDFLGGHH